MAWSSLIVQYDQPLTDAQLRANDVKITLDGETVALSPATITSLLGRSWNLSNASDSVTVHQGTSPWVVSGTVTSTPSGTQDVNITSSTTLPVSVDNFPTEYPLPTAQVTSLKTVTVDNQIAQPVQDGGTVNVGNQPTDYPDSEAHNRLGTEGAGPPTIAGTGVMGYLRAVYDRLVGGLNVNNLPSDYATAANQLPDNHQVTVSNQINQPLEDGGGVVVTNLPADYPLPAAQVTALTPQTDALTETQLRTVLPDTAGTWSYAAGSSGSPAITGRVLQITATAGLLAGSITIDGGDAITIPAGKSITIEPRGNLTSPTIAFTSTEAYFVEVVS